MPFFQNLGPLELLVIFGALCAIVILVLPFFFIFQKAGFSTWLGLLMFIPLVNLIALYVLAFTTWPALQRTQ